MKRQVSAETRSQVLQALRARYRGAAREEKNQILNHLAAITRYHRKHAIRLLGGHDHVQGKEPGVGAVPRRIYD
jgi:hypothetical protein